MNLAYAAGVFDGEGCVSFSRTRASAYIRVLVVNTNLELLRAFQRQFGGDIRPLAARKSGWKQGYQWRLGWTKAVEFLAAIHPWLRVKRQQAAVAFAWNAIRPGLGKRTAAAMREHGEAVDLLREYLSWLNKRGPQTAPNPIEMELSK